MFRIALSTLLICLPAACALPRPDDAGRLLLATVDEDPSLASIALNGTRLHVQDVGPRDALPVIVLHGGPGNDFRCMLPLIDPASGPISAPPTGSCSGTSAAPGCRDATRRKRSRWTLTSAISRRW